MACIQYIDIQKHFSRVLININHLYIPCWELPVNRLYSQRKFVLSFVRIFISIFY